MSWRGSRLPGSTIRAKFTTVDSTGAPTTLGGTPVVSVYKNDDTTESTAGVTLTIDFDSSTGLNLVVIDTSADGTFYSAGADFDVVITTGTVDGVSVVGYVVFSFSLATEALGANGLDASAFTANALNAINNEVAIGLTNYDASTGGEIAGVTGAIAAVEADTQNIQTRLPAALVNGNMPVSLEAVQGQDLNSTKPFNTV